jgi:hypothetical protein
VAGHRRDRARGQRSHCFAPTALHSVSPPVDSAGAPRGHAPTPPRHAPVRAATRHRHSLPTPPNHHGSWWLPRYGAPPQCAHSKRRHRVRSSARAASLHRAVHPRPANPRQYGPEALQHRHA